MLLLFCDHLMHQGKQLGLNLELPYLPSAAPSTSQASPPRVPPSQCLKNIFPSVWKVFLSFGAAQSFCPGTSSTHAPKTTSQEPGSWHRIQKRPLGKGCLPAQGLETAPASPVLSLLIAQGPEDRGDPCKISKEQKLYAGSTIFHF